MAGKYDVPLRDVVPLLLHFVVQEQRLTEGEVLHFSVLTISESRPAHPREDFQRERAGGPLRGLLDAAKEIAYDIWQVQDDR